MKLNTCQIQQIEHGDWHIKTKDDEFIAKLPRRLTDGEVVTIVEFAKRAESEAYKEGLSDGRGSMQAAYEQRIEHLMSHIKSLEHTNDILAKKLDNYLSTGNINNGNN
jgi:Mg2+ and Co2+ transporter CorA